MGNRTMALRYARALAEVLPAESARDEKRR